MAAFFVVFITFHSNGLVFRKNVLLPHVSHANHFEPLPLLRPFLPP